MDTDYYYQNTNPYQTIMDVGQTVNLLSSEQLGSIPRQGSMLPQESGLIRLTVYQEIAGSNPAGSVYQKKRGKKIMKKRKQKDQKKNPLRHQQIGYALDF